MAAQRVCKSSHALFNVCSDLDDMKKLKLFPFDRYVIITFVLVTQNVSFRLTINSTSISINESEFILVFSFWVLLHHTTNAYHFGYLRLEIFFFNFLDGRTVVYPKFVCSTFLALHGDPISVRSVYSISRKSHSLLCRNANLNLQVHWDNHNIIMALYPVYLQAYFHWKIDICA